MSTQNNPWTEYESVCDEVWAKFENTKTIALAERDRLQDEIEAEYQKTIAEARAKFESLRSVAHNKHIKATSENKTTSLSN